MNGDDRSTNLSSTPVEVENPFDALNRNDVDHLDDSLELTIKADGTLDDSELNLNFGEEVEQEIQEDPFNEVVEDNNSGEVGTKYIIIIFIYFNLVYY